MKGKDYTIAFLSLIILGLLWLFISEREKAKRNEMIVERLTKENSKLKNEYLSILEKFMIAEGKVKPSVIDELNKLKSKIIHLDNSVHLELDSVIRRMNDGEGTKAVKDLAKIVESILKDKAKEDKEYKKKKPMLHDLLLYAKEKNIICNRLYENGIKLKELRNKESHELNPNIPTLDIGISVLSGIEIIYAINRN